jgi:hypothetical protein
MVMFEKNKFIKWTGKDDQGKFSYTGQIKSVTDDVVVFEDSRGSEYGIPKDEGQWAPISKPKGWKKVPAPVAKPAPKAPKATRKSSSGGPTKKEQALILVRDIYGKGHGKDMAIQRIQDVLGMSKAGATTYFYNAKKEL